MSFRFEPLASNHDRESFACGEPALDDYLKTRAKQDARRYIAASFVMVDEADSKTIAGYYTLSAYAVDVSEFPDEVTKKMPKYPKLPAMLIGRLARDQKFPKTGDLLLFDALRRASAHVASIAAMAVVVDAKNDRAKDFYQRHGFIPVQNLPGKLFIPMSTVQTVLEQHGFQK
ncbi:MAG: GNAT family N-acetyltransferase [Verrucomicrobia bacterium]|nr:GNAT family N-acetyltransferase [Verrucomicrobiota bacterium]